MSAGISNFFRIALLSGCASIALTPAALAQATKPLAFDVPAESLGAALNDLAQQSHQEIVFDANIARDKTAPALKGTMTVRQALDIVLTGSDLRADISVSGVVTVTSKNVQAASNDGAAADLAVETVVVTGTHIAGGQPVGTNILTLSSLDIAQSGYGRTEDIFATLPQNLNANNAVQSQANIVNLNKGTQIQLRGLGTGTTLVLIDGQRLPSGDTQGTGVDISTIPLAAVDKIEVLPDGASAIYGSDAIGGVVNFIMKKDYDGAQTSVRLSSSADWQNNQIQVSQLVGTTWSTGHLMAAYEYSANSALTYNSRAYTAQSGYLVPFGGSDFRLPAGNPGTILTSAGLPAFAIPHNQNGTHLTVAQLSPGVNYRSLSNFDLMPSTEMNSLFVAGSQSITSFVDIVGEVQFSDRSIKQVSPGTTRAVSVPSTNPFYVNPFGGTAPVRVDYDFTRDLGPITQNSTTQFWTGDLAAKVHLPDGWELTVAGDYGKSINSWNEINLLNPAALTPALANTDPTMALNVFGDGSNTNPATLATLRETATERGASTEAEISAIISGELLELPGGAAKIAAGLDYRNEGLTTVGKNFDNFNTHNNRSISSGFAEVALPLISDAQEIAGARSLSVSAAGRYDHYTDAGDTFNPKVGVTWVPVDTLSLRGSWGTSFRAPPFYLENTSIQSAGAVQLAVSDPTSSSGTSNALIVLGGNPHLHPETATTWNVGADWTPVKDLMFDLTYYQIDYSDKIQSPPQGVGILGVESLYAGTGVITRNPSAAQISAICSQPIYSSGCTGTPVSVLLNLQYQNIAALSERGLDFQAKYSYETPIGLIGVGLNSTYMLDYNQQVSSGSPVADLSNTFALPIKLCTRGTVSWNDGPWSATATVNYAGAYKNPGNIVSHIDSWTTLDLGGRYDLSDASPLLKGIRANFVATNAFNERPPFVNVNFFGYDAVNANLVGRTIALQLVKDW